MKEMGMLERHFILKLKSQLFDIIETQNGSFSLDLLQEKLLFILKNMLNVNEITLFRNDWENQWRVEASTLGNKKSTMKTFFLSHLEWKDQANDSKILRKPISINFLSEYDLVFILKEKGETNCFLAIDNLEDYQSVPETFLEDLSEVCSLYLNKIKSLTKISLEVKRYKQLFRVTEKFHSSMNMESVLGEIIYTLQEVYPTFTYYLLLSHDNNSHGVLPIKDLEYDSENIAAMEAYVTGSIQFEDSIQEKRSVLYAPLKGKQGVYGVLQVIAPDTISFPQSEVEFITILANTAGGALENAQLYQQSKRLVSDLQLINETSHRLNSNLRLTETMSYMSGQIIHSFDAQEVGFFLTSEQESVNIINGSTGFFYTKEAEVYIQYFKEKIELEKDSLFVGDFCLQALYRIPYKSIMAVPMVQTGRLKGFALVMHQATYHFSFEDFKLLQSLIHHSTLAFTNTMLREELEKMVVTDHLTKLYSRNYLDEKIKSSFVEDSEGTFLLIDIDNFKLINDTYGHQIGDEVIIQVANVIKENTRGTDIGARWGGEELAIYLPRISLERGIVIANRLVQKVSEISNPHVTISCGVSYWAKDSSDSYSALFKRADKALYRAKETGKNKVIVH